MNKIIFSATAFMLAGGIFAIVKATELPQVKYTVRVTNEEGKPLENIDVKGGFGKPHNSWTGDTMNSGIDIVKKTNDHGLVFFEGRGTSTVGISISSKGFYYHGIKYRFQSVKNRKWQPWNPTIDLVLRPILNPMKMYGKRFQKLGFNVYDQPVGLDMVAGDWMAPYGSGKTADMFFTAHYEKRSDYDSDTWIEVSFPNKGDGIQEFKVSKDFGSSFRSPRFAPESGYLPIHRSSMIRRPGKATQGNMDVSGNRYFFLRVKTVLDENGNVKNAHYAKIYGELNQFSYFLNPTPNDRNMEYGGNLLKGLDGMEQPDGP